MKVFCVEDDKMIREGLAMALRSEGYEVTACGGMKEALDTFKADGNYDICLLDVSLPDGDGFEICREIRSSRNTPVIFLTACDDEIHTVMALEQGADDYITKPFRIRELIARMKAVLRRTGSLSENDIFRIGDNELYIRNAKMYRHGEEIVLTSMEYKLLMVFVNNVGTVLTRQQILNILWDEVGNYVNDNTLTVYVKRLREKLGEDPDNPYIATIRGIGYRLERR